MRNSYATRAQVRSSQAFDVLDNRYEYRTIVATVIVRMLSEFDVTSVLWYKK
jgi:hypothetical protein